MSDIILLSFQRPVIIHLVATTADFPFSVTIVGTATLLGDLVDNVAVISPRLVVEDSALAFTSLSTPPYFKITKENTTPK